ncbi:PDZ domain-containing protein [Longimicrobium sp.]|jgi:hypothetical protein|uniref:PDZ domain-containing protein n=1 Tax=Longimicrobium sp. TaxID=2029185 RepID=UPI002ED8C883
MSFLRRAIPILSLLAAPAPLAGQTPAPDPLSAAKHVDERYELYAPTQQDVDRARPYVERAIEGFSRAFGEPAPRVAVVLFDANAALAAFDEAPLARRGLATRRWLTEQASAQRSTDLVAATPLGVVVGSAPGGAGVRVVAALPGGAAAVGLQPGDVIKSLNGTAVATLSEFAGLFDALAVGTQARLEVNRGGTVVQVAFAKHAGSNLGRLAGPAQQITGGTGATHGDVLTHETTHTLLDAYVQSRLGTPPGGTVGRVPSWLHEAVAQFVEFPTAEARAPRRETARQLLGSHTPLAELFSMQHPMAALLAGPDGSVRPSAGGTSIMVRPGSAAPGGSAPQSTGIISIAAPSRASAGFYPQALSLLEFLIARAGPEILPRLAVGLASGKTVGQVLAEAKAPMPTEPAALEREWAAWVAAQAPAAQ